MSAVDEVATLLEAKRAELEELLERYNAALSALGRTPLAQSAEEVLKIPSYIRRPILRVLASRGVMSAVEIAVHTKLRPGEVSVGLEILAQTGVIRETPQGYRLTRPPRMRPKRSPARQYDPVTASVLGELAVSRAVAASPITIVAKKPPSRKTDAIKWALTSSGQPSMTASEVVSFLRWPKQKEKKVQTTLTMLARQPGSGVEKAPRGYRPSQQG